MKKFILVFCSCCLCCLTVLAFSVTTAHAKHGGSSHSGGGTVCICHRPPGNPANAHTICIGEPAVRAHLRHGDTMGECPVTCDSGDDCHANQFCKRADGVCAENASGICTNKPTTCPTTITPVCGCNGTTYDNACEANAAGVNVASEGACQGGTCGGTAGGTCGANQFCKTELGVCDPNAEGICTTIPAPCPTNIDLVCGCDGTTYNNACEANAAGVNVASAGECAGGGGTACGGAAGDTCADDQFCKLETGACSADAEGVCTAIPGVCHPDFNPVCGCDAVTYSNECFAASAGASVAATGACAQGAACVVGGGTCAEGEFCRPAVGDCAASAEGHCTTIPEVCPPPLSNIPVCGCDGVSYANACAAFSAGVGIASQGECEADQQACGGVAGTCPEGEFCKRPLGECADDAEGICEPTPPICPATIAPVCGCDGITYDNACVADAAGVTVASEGECQPPEVPVACDGVSGGTCGEGEFCKHADGACAADAEGTCTALPLVCTPIVLEVCGCDGNTYPSACFANGAGVNVDHTDACTSTP